MSRTHRIVIGVMGAADAPKDVLRLAEKAGIKPISAEQAQSATAKGGNRLRAANHTELLRGEISELILEYAPAERHLVDAYRTPTVKRATSKKDSSED